MSGMLGGVVTQAEPMDASDSRWSLWSEASLLSIGSSHSVLSIGSVGSVLSIGSVGSAASVFSIGAAGSVGSALSALSRWSLLSFRSSQAVAGSTHTGAGNPTTILAAVVAAGVVARYASRRRTS